MFKRFAWRFGQESFALSGSFSLAEILPISQQTTGRMSLISEDSAQVKVNLLKIQGVGCFQEVKQPVNGLVRQTLKHEKQAKAKYPKQPP